MTEDRTASSTLTEEIADTRIPVKVGDIAPFATKRCHLCQGRGELSLVIGTDRKGRLCGCALTRFMKKNKSDVTIDLKSGQVFWNRQIPNESGTLE